MRSAGARNSNLDRVRSRHDIRNNRGQNRRLGYTIHDVGERVWSAHRHAVEQELEGSAVRLHARCHIAQEFGRDVGADRQKAIHQIDRLRKAAARRCHAAEIAHGKLG